MTVTGVPLGTKVAYCSNDGKVGLIPSTSAVVNLSGVDPNSTLMLYNSNCIPFIAPLVLQNVELDNSQYVIAGEVQAGRSVDSGRTYGEVRICDGANYEIEAFGEVEITGGFTVEKGSSFAVYPSSFK